jgi:GrpB-like predicted nucleotidyltransferase (UPF0157 family)
MRTTDVIVLPYDPQWREEFLRLRAYLAAALTGGVLAIEHVGSTAVAGLAAKPILDLDVVIASAADFADVNARLQALAYYHEGDKGIPGREAFGYTAKPEFMRHHLYVCAQDAPELRRHLAFRDYLRAHAEARAAYGATKLAAAKLFPHDIEAYLAYKTPFIQGVYQQLGL